MKQLETLAMALVFAAALFVAPLAAADNAAHEQHEDGRQAAAQASARIAIEADRVYSFVEPRDGRLTALLIANGRPSVTVSIDRAIGMVDVTATDGRSERYTIADLADAYAAGDTERRAAFLVSLQRKASATDTETECDTATANCAPSNQALWAGDASAANAAPDQYRSATLAAIVRWAADHVGSQRDLAATSRCETVNGGDDGFGSRERCEAAESALCGGKLASPSGVDHFEVGAGAKYWRLVSRRVGGEDPYPNLGVCFHLFKR